MSSEVYCPENEPGYEYDPREVERNVRSAHERGLPSINLEGGDREAVINVIGGGPTHRMFLERQDVVDGIVVVTGTSHALFERNDAGEIPLKKADILVMNAHEPEWVDVFKAPQPDVQYWLSSVANPGVFDKLEGADIRLWDAYVPDVDVPETGRPVIGGGSTASSAALAVFMQMGFKNFEFYGVDGGSFAVLPDEYVGYDIQDVLDQFDAEEYMVVQVGGEQMKVTVNLWNQLEEFGALINEYGEGCSFTFHGESLNSLVFGSGLDVQILHDPRITVGHDGPDIGAP